MAETRSFGPVSGAADQRHGKGEEPPLPWTEQGQAVIAAVIIAAVALITIFVLLWSTVNSANQINSTATEIVDSGNVAPPQGAVEVALDSVLRNLPPGRVLFDAPDAMRVAERERIVVRISRDLKGDISEGLRTSGVSDIDVDVLDQVSPLMSATLDGSSFDIRPLSSEDQPVAETGFTQWEWDVTPKESGTQVLQLRLSLRIALPERTDERKSIPVEEKFIRVHVNLPNTVQSFWGNNWKWVLGTGSPVLVALGWAARKIVKRKAAG